MRGSLHLLCIVTMMSDFVDQYKVPGVVVPVVVLGVVVPVVVPGVVERLTGAALYKILVYARFNKQES